jgi:RHS repeat-associated protein
MCLVNYTSANTGAAMYYGRDVQGRLVYRESSTITAGSWALNSNEWYGYSGSGDTPDFVRDANWNITEKYLQLPGGVLLTIKPQQTGNAQKQYSLPNVHGDTLLITDATGANTSTGNGPANSFTYDPFGNILAGSTLPSNITGTGSFGWVGTNEKFTENTMVLNPVQMGARAYLPTLGRFTSVDPVQGGTPNNYVYPTDPVDGFDLTGQMSASSAWTLAGAGITVVGFGVCIAATAGVCTAAAVATAIAGGATTTASARAGGDSWGKSIAQGGIDTGIGLLGARGVQAVRWYGEGRNYVSLSKALTKQAAKSRAKKLTKDLVKDQVRSKAINWGWNQSTRSWK